MKTKILGFFLAAALITTASCSDDDSGNDNGNSSREVKYEITGTFTGTLDVAYTTANGSPFLEEVSTLPWTEEFTALPTTQGVTITASGAGEPGETITLKIFVGDEEVASANGVANSNGIVSAATLPYVFPN